MTILLRAVPLLLALLIGLPLRAEAGVALQGKSGQKGRPIAMDLEGKRLRTDASDGHERTMVFDGEAQRMLLIDSGKKTYRVMDETTARAAADKLGQELAKLPPEAREKLKAALASRKEGAPAAPHHRWSLEATGGSGTAAGRSCRYYRVLKDGKPDEGSRGHGEVCLIPWGGDLRREDFAAWAALGVFSEKLASAMAGGLTGGATGGAGRSAQTGRLFGAWFGEAPGLPGLSAHLDGSGQRVEDWELTSIERRAFPADHFAAPPGYRRVDQGE
jgi:hypothetical protein